MLVTIGAFRHPKHRTSKPYDSSLLRRGSAGYPNKKAKKNIYIYRNRTGSLLPSHHAPRAFLFLFFLLSSFPTTQRRRRRQRERHKSNRFIRHCTTTTWKCLISRFVEDGNTRQQLSFSFPELWYSPLEFNSRKIWQHLTNWNKRDKVWSGANSLFKWRFRSRRRRCCLSSLLGLLPQRSFRLWNARWRENQLWWTGC